MKTVTLSVALAAFAFTGVANAATTTPARDARGHFVKAAAPAAKPVAAPKPALAAPKPAAATGAAKPSIFSRMMGTKPAAAAAAPRRAAAPVGRVVTATTTTGKTVHYDCGKAGNATKKACH